MKDGRKGAALLAVLAACVPHVDPPSPPSHEELGSGEGDDTGDVSTPGDSDTGTPDTGTPVDTGGDTASGGDSGGKDTSGGTDTSIVDTAGDTAVVDTGVLHGTFVEFTFGDGGTCAATPWTDSSGGAIPRAMIFSDGAGSCGSFIYGGGSSSAPATALLYEGTGFTSGTLYTAEMDVENTLGTTVGVYADFGGGSVSSLSLAGGASGTFTVSMTADATGAADLRVWTDSATSYDVVMYGAVISY